jgi:hypothetical protein
VLGTIWGNLRVVLRRSQRVCFDGVVELCHAHRGGFKGRRAMGPTAPA